VVDLALWLMDNHEPRTVLGACHREIGLSGSPANRWGNWDPADFTVEDAAFGMVQMADGATLLIETSWALNTAYEADPALSLSGTRGGVDVWQDLRITEERAGKLVTTVPELGVGPEAQWQVACRDNVRNFVGAIQGREPLVVTARQALTVTRVLEAIYRSAEEGRAVHLNRDGAFAGASA
jgi:predicted dehydrogenase